jgi:hypothetical protein
MWHTLCPWQPFSFFSSQNVEEVAIGLQRNVLQELGIDVEKGEQALRVAHMTHGSDTELIARMRGFTMKYVHLVHQCVFLCT